MCAHNEALKKMLVIWTSLLNDAEDDFGRDHFKRSMPLKYPTLMYNVISHSRAMVSVNGVLRFLAFLVPV